MRAPKRVLSALTVAMATVVTAGPAHADATPDVVSIGRLRLVAHGVAVDVPVKVRCSPVTSNAYLSVTVQQEVAAHNQAIGVDFIGLGDESSLDRLTCDGTTHRYVIRVVATENAFRVGAAEVQVRASELIDGDWRVDQESLETRIRPR